MATRNTALVTGSARRLGFAIARDLAATGFNVVLHSRSGRSAAAAAEHIDEGCLGFVTGDLTDARAPAHVVGEALKLSAGHLSLIVNNSSAFVRRPPRQTTIEDWELELALGARAPFFMAVAAYPVLKATGGMVLNISDYAAVDGWPAFAAHSVAKGALEAVTITQANAFRGEVRVNAICPPSIRLPGDVPGAEAGSGASGLRNDPHGTVPASAVTSALLELYMGEQTGRIVRLGNPSGSDDDS